MLATARAAGAVVARRWPPGTGHAKPAHHGAALTILGLPYAMSRANAQGEGRRRPKDGSRGTYTEPRDKAATLAELGPACPISELISVLPQRFENGHHSTSSASAPRSARVPI